MAILKHITSKNADYGEAQRYLNFQHDESTGKPILDENGKMILRDEYCMDGINCDPFTFDVECNELNAHYHKNQNYDEIKSHHYIISFDPKDRDEKGLTGERAQQLGLEYAEKNFPGHQALVCTHTDGHNGSGNIHIHIVINSLRKFDVERQDFMERPCDSRAGNKHHLTKKYLVHLKQSVMNMCHRENLYQVDLLTPAKRKITEKEYWANRRGQKKLDERNSHIIADGITPRKTKFQTEKDYLRISIEDAARSACNLQEFQKILSTKFKITLKISRGRFSYLHPERNKPITGRSLGTLYENEYLLNLFEKNVLIKESNKNDSENREDTQKPITSAERNSGFKDADPIAIIFIKSDLRLILDLQQSIKTQQSQAYAQKVKLSNLKEMAKTISYVQEHGYNTKEKIDQTLIEAKEQTSIARKALKSTENRLREINEQIHYTGQYLANKSVYFEFCKSKNKGKFRQEHSAEIKLYETAAKFLKDKSSDGKLPSMKYLKEEKGKLLAQKKRQQEKYQYCRDFQKELHTVCSNVDTILGNPHPKQPKQQKKQDIS
ncbi:relaxase/mobilization nuclease domain-containing protein [Lacrimispora xylanisolvens]|uniref:relaxase/mobilization nuclease domain-containing protein n=1 Tax=Lacrimispora xylanisolvens TaxID=384636 RepID=UPI0024026A57